MTELTDVLPQSETVTIGGREFQVKPISMNGLALLEEKYGDLGSVPLQKISTQRYILWVILSSEDPSLTEQEVGNLITFQDAPQANALILRILQRSGFFAGADTPSDGAEVDNPKKRAAKA